MLLSERRRESLAARRARGEPYHLRRARAPSLPAMIASILPATVACAELHQDLDDVALFPDEQSIIAGAVRARRRQLSQSSSCRGEKDISRRVSQQPIPRWRELERKRRESPALVLLVVRFGL